MTRRKADNRIRIYIALSDAKLIRNILSKNIPVTSFEADAVLRVINKINENLNDKERLSSSS